MLTPSPTSKGIANPVTRFKNAEEALCLSDTQTAANYLDKNNELKLYTKARDMSADEFRAQPLLPTFNIYKNDTLRGAFDKDCFKELDEDLETNQFRCDGNHPFRHINDRIFKDSARNGK